MGRAGLKAWPKLFVNLRATRTFGLRRRFPSHVANAWLGHTEEAANEHYLSVTQADYEQALQAVEAKPGKAARQAARNSAQAVAGRGRTGGNPKRKPP